MPGFFQWVSDTVSSAYQGAKNVVTGIGNTFSVIGSVLSAESFRTGLVNWLTQSWDGFTRALNPMHLVSLLGRPKTGRVWLTSTAYSLLRAAPIVAYHYGRPLVRETVHATVSENPWVETLAMSVVDAAAYTLMLRNAARGYADAVVYDTDMAKASADETKLDTPTNNPMMKPCGHGDQANVTAGVTSLVHYYGSWVALRMLASTLPYGEAVTLPLQMLLIGRGFMEYPLAAAGNCTEDRLDVLNKNNPYALGMGASYMASKLFWQTVLERYTGTSGIFIDEVLTAMLTLHFIMASNLSRQTPLPGTETGLDIFSAPRKITDVVVSETAGFIAGQFSGPAEGDWYQLAKADISAKLNHQAVQILCLLLVDESFQDWDKFAERPATKLFFEMYGDVILQAIDYIQAERARTDYQRIEAANQWANNRKDNESFLKAFAKSTVSTLISAVASDDDLKVLGILMQKEFERPLSEWRTYIMRQMHTAKVTKMGETDIIDDYGAEAPVPPQRGFYQTDDTVVKKPVEPVFDERILTREFVRVVQEEAVAPSPSSSAVRPPPPLFSPVATPSQTGLFSDVVAKKKKKDKLSEKPVVNVADDIIKSWSGM